MDILEELSALRRADAEEAARATPLAALERQIANLPPARDFAGAFRGAGIHILAELKKASPSEGLIRADFDPAPLARGYAAAGAAAISVLCEPHKFLGHVDYLTAVRAAVDVPLLFKDFLTTEYQIAAARVAGADACLLIAAVLSEAALRRLLAAAHAWGLAALVETHTVEEAARAVACGAHIIGVNCRDLRTFKTDPALTARLIAQLPPHVVRIGESGLHTGGDIAAVRAAGADGFLVGTALMRAPDPGAKLRALIAEALTVSK